MKTLKLKHYRIRLFMCLSLLSVGLYAQDYNYNINDYGTINNDGMFPSEYSLTEQDISNTVWSDITYTNKLSSLFSGMQASGDDPLYPGNYQELGGVERAPTPIGDGMSVFLLGVIGYVMVLWVSNRKQELLIKNDQYTNKNT
jgi:hypothetical protein